MAQREAKKKKSKENKAFARQEIDFQVEYASSFPMQTQFSHQP